MDKLLIFLFIIIDIAFFILMIFSWFGKGIPVRNQELYTKESIRELNKKLVIPYLVSFIITLGQISYLYFTHESDISFYIILNAILSMLYDNLRKKTLVGKYGYISDKL